MGQGEVIIVLSKMKREMTTPELCNFIDTNLRSVVRAVSKLLQEPEPPISMRILTVEEKIKRFGRNIPSKIVVYSIKK